MDKQEFVTLVAFEGGGWEPREQQVEDFLLDAVLYLLNFKPYECITC